MKMQILFSAAVFGATACMSAASAQTLFTTQEDFTGWSGANLTLTADTASLDADATNGLGNTTAAGAAGTSGSLSVTHVSGAYNAFTSPGEQDNVAFLAALGSGGELAVDFTTPTDATGTGNYFGLLLHFNYDGTWAQISPTTSSTVGNVTTNVYDYTINVTDYSYFQLGLIYNSNFTEGTFTVDNIRIVPEPASLALMACGGLSLLRRRGR